MDSSGASRPGRPALYGGLPEPGPPGFPARLLEFADELRREGMAVGTSELLDAFHALGELSERIRQALREGSDGEMRDLARLAIAAFGRQGEGSGVIGVDVQRIRRTLGLKGEAGRELPDPDSVPQDRLREFERMLRREL